MKARYVLGRKKKTQREQQQIVHSKLTASNLASLHCTKK